MKASVIASLLMAGTAMCAVAASPYIARVYEFCPAPGQFVHEIPAISDDMTPAQVIAEVESQICGNETDGATPGMISLGAFGGYVVFGFDHPVVNVAGQPDFKIYGNAFKSDADGGSAEPGIVMVSVDANANGLPDDEWFELRGSEHGNEATVNGFEITYRRPADDSSDIAWTSNCADYQSGTVGRNQFHTQSYWPAWYAGETLTFKGTRLPDNAVDKTGDGSSWLLRSFEWGYVDNRSDADDSGLDIGNAVNAGGESVDLPMIHFVKVYTAMNQSCGWIGETSTEVRGGEDLHPDAVPASIRTIGIAGPDAEAVRLYDLQGRPVASQPAVPGIYLKVSAAGVTKVLVK